MLIMADRLATTVTRSSVRAQQRNFDSISPCLKLNDDACLNLDVIIGSFSAPITEEHAWAIVFEAVKCLENLVKNPNFSSNINTPSGVTAGKQGDESETYVKSATNKVLRENKSEVHKKENLINGIICDKGVDRRHKKRIHLVTKPSDVFLHRDGRVHEISFLGAQKSSDGVSDGMTDTASSRPIASSVEKAITELGVVIYSALDFGLREAEERQLTPGLEKLLDLMTSLDVDCSGNSSGNNNEQPRNHFRTASNSSTGSNGGVGWDDEGIEQDHEDDLDSVDPRPLSPRSFENMNTTFATASALKATDHVLRLCEHHLSDGSEAAAHYRNVCRALVSEALELSSFLEKAWLKKKGDDGDFREELQELALRDWAHLWIQAMDDLRQGVKLKKTNFTKTPIEYALTPYEMLMDDIRSKRYKLNKVITDDGQLPLRVKKDAHDIILEFIRSRPPLRPASRRKLAPLRKYSTPQELLLTDIASDNARKSLKKTTPPVSKLSLPNWDSSKIFRPLHERQQEEEEDDIYHIVHNYPLRNDKGEIILEHDENDYKLNKRFGNTEYEQIVSIRRVSRHRKGANVSRPSSQASNNPELNGRRPYSMSCLFVSDVKNSYKHSMDPVYPISKRLSKFGESEDNRAGSTSQKTLIRPDPSFNFNPSSSDSDEDSPDRMQNKHYKHRQHEFPDRLRGSESVACIPSNIQSHSDSRWQDECSNNDTPMLSSPNNLRRHTLGQQHLLRHQKQLLQSQQQLSVQVNRSRENVFDDSDEDTTDTATLRQRLSSTLSVPQNGPRQLPDTSSQISRMKQPICHSSTPKITKKADTMMEPTTLFPSYEVSPVVSRESNTYNEPLRTNMVQTTNPSKHNVASLQNNDIFYNTKIKNPSIMMPSSMMNFKHANNNTGSGLEKLNTDGVLINPVLLHQEQMRKMNNSSYLRSFSTPCGQSLHKKFNSSTNIDTNTTAKILHEKPEHKTFCVSRKAAPTKVDYGRANGNFAKNMNHLDVARQQANVYDSYMPSIKESNGVNIYGAQRPTSVHEQMIWTNGLTLPINPNNQRKLSAPAHFGGISMEHVGATENSIYLRQGVDFHGVNMEQSLDCNSPIVSNPPRQDNRSDIWNGQSDTFQTPVQKSCQRTSVVSSPDKTVEREKSKGLNLSHDEVAHIRSVLAKAKLEALPLTQELRSDLERSRVCFQCMKVKFSLFSWAYTCKLCRHSVCAKCITKAALPEDHFRNVPVGALSPSIEMQQKQQQNLLQRKTSLTNTVSPLITNSSTKQQRSNSFWNHFGIGGNKNEDLRNDKSTNDSQTRNMPSIAVHDECGYSRNVESNGKPEPNAGMAPRVRLRRSNTITSRVPDPPTQSTQMPGALPQNMSRSIRGNDIAVSNNCSTQAGLENGQKTGWTTKFNSMGSNSTASVTGVNNGVGNISSQITICLECKDVVDNIGRKNTANNPNSVDVVDVQDHQKQITMRTSKSSITPLAREMRNLHTRSMIIE